ncbi:hypothetical protein PgNI_11416 [Pyricularia grisea]|uniref:Uncharacterized protein n=1 Tax=Pyricularia grisea TaxID=148305 RepID=A0A6P8AQ72_PYRGI|nr:hypothetical protein PgNI_11416 [Pyricularia grisea]TLD04168.1 hypothetical protein PgNI_11416 [Pyricularia grisea]
MNYVPASKLFFTGDKNLAAIPGEGIVFTTDITQTLFAREALGEGVNCIGEGDLTATKLGLAGNLGP